MTRIASALLLIALVASCEGAPAAARRDGVRGAGGEERSRPLPPPLAAAAGMTLASPAFADGAAIPAQYSCDGAGGSPPLVIAGVPAAARALALLVEDPDAPSGTFTHWAVWNIPADARGVAAGARFEGATEGENGFGNVGWGAPCPPRGTHRYLFRLIALSAPVKDRDGIAAHAIAEARLLGRYSRR